MVAAVAGFLFDLGANIVSSDQHSTDPEGGHFFMRNEFDLPGLDTHLAEVEAKFRPVADRFGMTWTLALASRRKRIGILVSREDHCLLELLWRWRAGDLPAEIAMVISNHNDVKGAVEGWGVPFHHIPVTAASKTDAEAEASALLRGKVDLVVLARYMQVLSPEFLAQWPGRIINIHHSFLPAFVGAKPYEQAYARGVKLIGATAHYATEELDAGPIIEQDTARVDHRHNAADLRRIGKYIERQVLARAVGWHLDDRIVIHGNKTVVLE